MSDSAETDAPALQVSLQEETPVARTLCVELEPERVDAAFERAYRKLRRSVRVRGFRPGKAPRDVIERLYGAAVAEDVSRNLLAESLPAALAQAGLEPVAEPAIDAGAAARGTPFRYTARVEVKPEIALPELSGLPARRPRVAVGLEQIEAELEALRQRQAVLVEEPEGTRAGPGSVLAIDFEGRVDGAPFEGGSGQNVEVEIGSERFLPGFEDQLRGARSGEEREVRATLPEDQEGPLAGKEAVFSVRVLAVKRREVPELDDEFAKDLGEFDSLDALRSRVREELGTAQEREAERALRRSLLEALVERTSFELPAGMVEHRLERRLAQAHRELEKQVPEDALRAQLARWQEEWRPAAEREVREELLLDAVVQERAIEVTEEQLEARIAALAGDEAGDRKRLRKAYEKGGLLPVLRSGMAREQALDFLIAEAKVEETTDT